MSEALLDVTDLSIHFGPEDDPSKAVDKVSFSVKRGETVVLVGESGSGKSISALSVLRLLPHAARVPSGKITLSGVDILAKRLNVDGDHNKRCRCLRSLAILQN